MRNCTGKQYSTRGVGLGSIQKVREALRVKPSTPAELAEATGLSRATVGAALAHIGEVSAELPPLGGRNNGRRRQVWVLAQEART